MWLSRFANLRLLFVIEDISNQLDKSVDPCNDFYSYTCGGFFRSHKLGANESYVDSFSIVYNDNLKVLRSTLQNSSFNYSQVGVSLSSCCCCASARERAREKKAIDLLLFSLFPTTNPLRFRSMNPPPCFFPYAHSTISEEKIEGLWTGYSRSPVMNYFHHERNSWRAPESMLRLILPIDRSRQSTHVAERGQGRAWTRPKSPRVFHIRKFHLVLYSRAVTATKRSKECVARANLVCLLNLLLFWRSRCLLRFSLERYADYDLTYCLSIYLQSLSIKKTIKIYNSCLNTTAINNRGKDPLVKLIEKYGGWTVTNTKRSNVLLEELMGRVLKELNVQTLLKVVVVTDLYDSNKHILNVSTNKAYSVSWPCLLHPYTSIRRGRTRTRDIFR